VLQGGGVKGIGLVGAVNTLREVSYPDVQRVAGTSAGAIVAALIAAGTLSGQIENAMRGLDYVRFEDGGLLPHLSGYPARAWNCCCTAASTKPTSCTAGSPTIWWPATCAFGPGDYKILCDIDPYDLPVADAITASASIPFFFQP
jgi:NTE family protein